MAEVAHTTRKQSMQMAGVIAAGVLLLNVMFYFGSHFYFKDKNLAHVNVAAVRIAFATMSMIVALSAFGAALAPRLIGHGLAFLMGVSSFVGGIVALGKGLPPVMGMTMLLLGVLIPVLAWKSLNYSRAAWAFLIAIVAVFGAVDFFGAPKIRGVLGIGLWHAMILPGLQIVCVIALSMLRDEYRES